jgi:predicted lipid-binding transport protein (Tim44 family)
MMSRIIAGRFDSTIDADAAIEALCGEGFTPDEIDSFYVAPPGQNAMTPLGGDAPHASAGSRFAGAGAIAGALIGGLIGMLIGLLIDGRYGAVVVLFSAAVGAYVGSFLGAMRKVRGGRPEEASVEHPVEPKGGRMIAVNVDRPGMDARALKVLRQFGARDVGRADGTWRNGWTDFDPRAPLMAP